MLHLKRKTSQKRQKQVTEGKEKSVQLSVYMALLLLLHLHVLYQALLLLIRHQSLWVQMKETPDKNHTKIIVSFEIITPEL